MEIIKKPLLTNPNLIVDFTVAPEHLKGHKKLPTTDAPKDDLVKKYQR